MIHGLDTVYREKKEPVNNFSLFLQSKSVIFVGESMMLKHLKLAMSKLEGDNIH